jgi:hypothetical protein
LEEEDKNTKKEDSRILKKYVYELYIGWEYSKAFCRLGHGKSVSKKEHAFFCRCWDLKPPPLHVTVDTQREERTKREERRPLLSLTLLRLGGGGGGE